MTTAIVNFYIPLIAMIAINTKIYLVIHKRYRNPIMRYSSIITQENDIKSTKLKSSSICSSNYDDKLNSNERPRKLSKLNFNLNLFSTINDSKSYNLIIINNQLKKRSKSVENFQSNETVNTKEPCSDSRCNKLSSDTSKTRKSRSVIAELQQIRRIPDNSVKIKRLVYCEAKLVPSTKENSQEITERVSPLFYRKQSVQTHDKIDKNLKEISKNLPSKNSRNRLNRKGFMNKQEKAFKQLSSIVIGFTLCFTPYFIVFLIVAICENCVSDEVFTVTVWLGYFNSTMNPFLYALFNNNRIEKSEMKKNRNSNDFYSKKPFKGAINNRMSIW